MSLISSLQTTLGLVAAALATCAASLAQAQGFDAEFAADYSVINLGEPPAPIVPQESTMKLAFPVRLNCAALMSVLLIASTGLPLAASAQVSPPALSALPSEALQQLENLSAAGGPTQGVLARINRMTDPNAGKRVGDEKLGCAQIKAEFGQVNQNYTAQRARQEATRQAIESDARQAQAEASGPGAIASGFLGGLAAVGAHAVGAGDAYNEKLKAEAIATQSKREALQYEFAQEAEASKALSDRGRALMSLGQAKGCTGLVYTP